MQKLKIILTTLLISTSIGAMERVQEERIPLLSLRTREVTTPSRLHHECIEKAESYQDLLSKIDELSPYDRNTIRGWIKDETEQWEQAVAAIDQTGVNSLFAVLRNKLQQECHTNTPVFQENSSLVNNGFWEQCCFTSHMMTHRALSPDFKKYVKRTAQASPDVNVAKQFYYNFKKWKLYFEYFLQCASSKTQLQSFKASSLLAIPTAFAGAAFYSLMQGEITPCIWFLGAETVSGASWCASAKLDLFGNQRARWIKNEIEFAKKEFDNFLGPLEMIKRKRVCHAKMEDAYATLPIHQSLPANLAERKAWIYELLKGDNIIGLEEATLATRTAIDAYLAALKLSNKGTTS